MALSTRLAVATIGAIGAAAGGGARAAAPPVIVEEGGVARKAAGGDHDPPRRPPEDVATVPGHKAGLLQERPPRRCRDELAVNASHDELAEPPVVDEGAERGKGGAGRGGIVRRGQGL